MKFFQTFFVAAVSLVCVAMLAPALCLADEIVLDGSTTVLPIAQKAAEQYMKKNPAVNISVRGGGSSVGIASLISKTCDIADSSRRIKSEELKKAASAGVDAVANVIAMDGICVIVHPQNSLSALTKEQLKGIFTGKTTDWSQLGGNTGKIIAVSRDSSSGTFEAFNELALEKARVRPDALMQASNQAVVAAVAQTPGAIGYVGLGYLSEKVKGLIVDGVEPSTKTVLSGKYPLSRPLFMYTSGKPKGRVKQFLDFIKSAEGQRLVQEEGFVPLK